MEKNERTKQLCERSSHGTIVLQLWRQQVGKHGRHAKSKAKNSEHEATTKKTKTTNESSDGRTTIFVAASQVSPPRHPLAHRSGYRLSCHQLLWNLQPNKQANARTESR